jgi:uncharacterized protein YidB (DUF937 family)
MATDAGWETIVPGSTATPTTPKAEAGWETISKPTTKEVGSQLHNIGRTAVETVPSAAAGLAGFGAGMAAAAPVAAAVAPFTGPFAPITAAVVEFGGGLGGAFAASGAAQKVTDWMHEAFAPEDFKQRQIEKAQHPYSTFAAQTLTNLAGMSPKTMPEVAGKLLTKPLVQRGVSAGLMGSIEAGSELASEGKVDPIKVAGAAASGAAMPGFNVAGKKVFEAGKGAVEAVLPKPRSAVTPPPPPDHTLTKPPEGATPEEKAAYIEKVKGVIEKRDRASPIVEAAIRNKETGAIERMGPKHDEARKAETIDTHEQGFINERGTFIDRKEAWNRAVEKGQIPKDQVPEFPAEGLHSGDLRKAGDERFKLTEEQPPGEPKPTPPKSRLEHFEDIAEMEFKLDLEEQTLENTAHKLTPEELEKGNKYLDELAAKIDQAKKDAPEAVVADKVKPTTEELHNLLAGSKHLGDALKILHEGGYGGKAQQWLAKKLASIPRVADTWLGVDPKGKHLPPEGSTPGQEWRGAYFPDIDSVFLYGKGNLQTLLHEAIHAATNNILNNATHHSAKALYKLWQHAFETIDPETYKLFKAGGLTEQELYQKHIVNQSNKNQPVHYGLFNVHEFVSEVHTNKGFIEVLKNVPRLKGVSSGSAWQDFKDIIKDMLGAKTKQEMAFVDQVLEHGAKVMEAPSEAAGGEVRPSKPSPTTADTDRTKKTEEGKGISQLQKFHTLKELQDTLEQKWDGYWYNVKTKEWSGNGGDHGDSALIDYPNKRGETDQDAKDVAVQHAVKDGYIRLSLNTAEVRGGVNVENVPNWVREWFAAHPKEKELHVFDVNKPNAQPQIVKRGWAGTRASLGEDTSPAVAVDRTKTSPRDVTSEQEFYDIAADIYEKHGDVEAVKFYEGYQGYKKTWAEPIKETEKFVGINIKNKLANSRLIHNAAAWLKEEVPDPARREAISLAIDKGDMYSLPPNERAAADYYAKLAAYMGAQAVEKGVVKGLLDNYVSHIIDWTGAPKNAREEFINELFGKGADPTMRGMDVSSKFAKERKLPTFEALEAWMAMANERIARAGKSDWRLRIKTKDIAEVYKEYAMSMQKAIENKSLVDSLKQVRNPAGHSLIVEVDKNNPMPQGWSMMNSPQFAGYAVHPDMLPALKFVFDAGPGDLMKALGAVSQLTKRMNVIGSFFHAKSLMEVISGSQIPIWTPVKEVALGGVDKLLGTKLSGITKALDQFRNGGVGDNVDKWIKEGGLQLEVPEDVSLGVLASTGKFADAMIGKYGPKTRVLEKSLATVEKYTLGMFDKFTWDFLHTGGKIMVADARLEQARRQAAEVGKPFDEVAQRKEIASFVNDSFGGLNWFDAAAQTRTELGKRMAMAAYNPQGRRALQVALFAPDWTISTLRAFTAALPKSLNPTKWHPVEGAKGMMTPTTKADYARLYQFKTAVTYLTLLNAINLMTAGRNIWGNKDPTRIEWPDGTSMQAMKHAMEPYHWMADPDKTLANKLGFIPKAAVVGLAGTEYASPQAQKLVDPSTAGRLKAIGQMVLPFQVQAALGSPEGEGAKRAVLGTLGFPEYGKTAAQKKEARGEREKALKKAAKEYHIKAKEKGWE